MPYRRTKNLVAEVGRICVPAFGLKKKGLDFLCLGFYKVNF
jgi:hypothetical protein